MSQNAQGISPRKSTWQAQPVKNRMKNEKLEQCGYLAKIEINLNDTNPTVRNYCF